MAREIAIGKRARISKAQQNTLLAVLGAGIFVGVALSLVSHFTKQISFNAGVIAEEDKAIVTYSDAIKNIGICKSPAGNVYSDKELENCQPDSISVSEIPNTLRANILTDMAQNESLNSVSKDNSTSCTNPTTKKPYTYDEMEEIYDKASNDGTDEELIAASELIQSCSALRIIPDALPAFKNEEALLAGLNKIFILSGWEPESLSPTGEASGAPIGNNLNQFSVRLSVESETDTTMRVLNNIERSIRDFNIERATIEWGSERTLILKAQASAYYMDRTTLTESTKTIKVGDE